MNYLVHNCTAIAETESAILVEGNFPNGEDKEWIPKSQINQEKSEILGNEDEGTLVVSEWFAKKREWK